MSEEQRKLTPEEQDEVWITLSKFTNERVKELTKRIQGYFVDELQVVPAGVAPPLIANALLGAAAAALAEVHGFEGPADTLEDVARGIRKDNPPPTVN